MALHSALESSEKLATWVDKKVHGLNAPSTERVQMAAALLDQVHEHHKAIGLLLKSELAGSAFSLVRPTFETFVRALWLLQCASEKEVEDFKNDKVEKNFTEITAEVEGLPGYGSGVLSRVKQSYWRQMCSYAHGGYLQARRRITEGYVKPNYLEKEKLEVLRFSDAFALFAAFEVFLLGQRKDLLEEVVQRMKAAAIPTT